MKLLYWAMYILTILFIFTGIVGLASSNDSNNPPVVYLAMAVATFLIARWADAKGKVRKSTKSSDS